MTSQAERRLMTSISLARCRCDSECFSVNDIDHTGIFKGCGYSSRLWLQFLKDVATGKNGRFAREFSGKSTISLKLCYLCPYDIRNGTLETFSKRTGT